jgi:hypothetical protein
MCINFKKSILILIKPVHYAAILFSIFFQQTNQQKTCTTVCGALVREIVCEEVPMSVNVCLGQRIRGQIVTLLTVCARGKKYQGNLLLSLQAAFREVFVFKWVLSFIGQFVDSKERCVWW